MDVGLHISSFTWPGGADTLADDLTTVARTADEAGFARISVMDHLWQISHLGPPEDEMLEAYTALGFLAAVTTRAQLLTWVTAVTYRTPGLLAKAATTVDVLSKGRAMLGIGAAWNEEESRGLGLDFPPTAERFERLEEALQIYQQMCSDNDGPYDGTHYKLGRTLNSPQPLSKPYPPILIGGGGEKKTLRLVAQYADACNLFDRDDVGHKLDVLRQHCADLGRDYDTVEKTIMVQPQLGENDDDTTYLLDALRKYADMGFVHAHMTLPHVSSLVAVNTLAEKVIPQVADW